MMTSEQWRGEVAALEAQAAELEAQAAGADAAELPRIGGTLAAIGAKLKAVRGKLAAALSLEAAKERDRQAKAEAAARQALLDRAAELQSQWLAWLADFDKADAEIADLWQRYAGMAASYGGLSRDLAQRDMLLGADVLAFGNLAGAAGESHAGTGRIIWKRG